MIDYIEREAASAVIRRLKSPTRSPAQNELIRMALVGIKGISVADVSPVRRGRWLCVDADTEQFFLCNRCKKKEYWESNYCPNCGAKMDGGAD